MRSHIVLGGPNRKITEHYLGRVIEQLKRTNTTEHLPHYLLALREFQEYFHYNTYLFNLSKLSRAVLQINTLQTTSLRVSNPPHSPKIKGLNRRSSVMLKKVNVTESERKKLPILTKKTNS